MVASKEIEYGLTTFFIFIHKVAKISYVYPEIYDILDTPDPDPLAELPLEFRERFLSARRENIEELAKRGIMTDSPEDRKIIKEAFERYGVIFTFTDVEDNSSLPCICAPIIN